MFTVLYSDGSIRTVSSLEKIVWQYAVKDGNITAEVVCIVRRYLS